MIRIKRGKEPPELAAVRSARLPIAAQHASKGTLERSHIDGYDVVKGPLSKVQHFKCCYCERPYLPTKGYDVEHYRPAIEAEQDGATRPGYWWLAWTWENLMFSCMNCNRFAKNSAFPLAPGCVPLNPMEAPPGQEVPLLIDPAAEDPIEHIEFRWIPRFGVDRKSRWVPVPRSSSERGRVTIREMKLDQPPLLDFYGMHVAEQVKPRVDRFRRFLARGDVPNAVEYWAKDILWLVKPAVPFSALSYDALGHLVPAADRSPLKLKLPRPGRR